MAEIYTRWDDPNGGSQPTSSTEPQDINNSQLLQVPQCIIYKHFNNKVMLWENVVHKQITMQSNKNDSCIDLTYHRMFSETVYCIDLLNKHKMPQPSDKIANEPVTTYATQSVVHARSHQWIAQTTWPGSLLIRDVGQFSD